MRTLVSAALLLATASASAAELSVSVDIPRLNVAEYHRPYVAIWIEPENGTPTTLSVWYDIKLRNSEGEKWLKDMRQWWRRDGRGLSMPVDGVSGATRAVGTHTLRFQSGQAPLGDLPPGRYTLLVEAAREVGGREVLSIPFTWPVSGAFSESVTGDTELGGVRLDITP